MIALLVHEQTANHTHESWKALYLIDSSGFLFAAVFLSD